MAAFHSLPKELKVAISRRSNFRIRRFVQQKNRTQEFLSTDFQTRILLVGDRPGPQRPDTPNFHHTPFYAGSNSSLYLHLQLEAADISEEGLNWVNAADHEGHDTDPLILQHDWSLIVALGGNALKWVLQNSTREFAMTAHPQYWRRFKGKQPYPLIQLLQNPQSKDIDGVRWYNVENNRIEHVR